MCVLFTDLIKRNGYLLTISVIIIIVIEFVKTWPTTAYLFSSLSIIMMRVLGWVPLRVGILSGQGLNHDTSPSLSHLVQNDL